VSIFLLIIWLFSTSKPAPTPTNETTHEEIYGILLRIMKKIKRKFSSEQKAQIVLGVIKNEASILETSKKMN